MSVRIEYNTLKTAIFHETKGKHIYGIHALRMQRQGAQPR